MPTDQVGGLKAHGTSPAKTKLERPIPCLGRRWIFPRTALRDSGNPGLQDLIGRVLIGVGRADWIRLPLPPNRTCGSPASGSPVDGLTFKRTHQPAQRRPA